MVAFFFFTSSDLFSIYRDVNLSLKRIVDEDKQLLIQSYRLGDIFTLKKYASSKIGSGRFKGLIFRELGDQNPIFALGEAIDRPDGSKFWLEGGTLNFKIHTFFDDRWGKGYVLVAAREMPMSVIGDSVVLAVFTSLLVFLFLAFVLQQFADELRRPIESLAESLSKQSGSDQQLLSQLDKNLKEKPDFDELAVFSSKLRTALVKILHQNDEIKRVEVLEALREQSRQVSHDIQSPLGALKVANDSYSKNPKLSAKLMSKAIQRVEAIVDDLDSELPTLINGERTEVSSFDLIEVLEDIRLEKLAEYRNCGLRIVIELGGRTAPLRGKEDDVSRLFSNLINNSVEASGENAFVRISAKVGDKQIRVTFEDHGDGISASDLPLVMNYGFSKNKESGSGTGLAHARRVMESLGGSIEIESKLDQGTRIHLYFNKVAVS